MASSLNRPCQSKNIPKPRSCEFLSLPSNHQSGCFPAIGFSRTWRKFLLTTVVSVLWQKWPQKVPFAPFKSHLSWSFLRKSENVTICSQLGGTPVKRGHLPFHLSAVRCWHHKDPTRSTTSRRSLRSLGFLWSLWSLWTCCLAFASRWSGAKRTCITWSLCTHWHWIQQIAHKSVKLSDLSTSYAHHKDIVFYIYLYSHHFVFICILWQQVQWHQAQALRAWVPVCLAWRAAMSSPGTAGHRKETTTRRCDITVTCIVLYLSFIYKIYSIWYLPNYSFG